jgi:protein tyrosine/serine phosphatase
LVNVRDLGGLRRTNGALTPHGVFLRSENIDSVTARGWGQLREHGVRTVIDLRQPRERARDRTPRPEWLTTVHVDLDGLEHEEFWKGYWDNGLVGTALYYTPHLQQLPQRSSAVLQAIANAPPGAVLFHCVGGRDRTGMIAMLLLAAAQTDPECIVEDYLETVRLGAVRAAHAGRADDEPELEAFCQNHGTTTEGAFRDALAALDIDLFLTTSGLGAREQQTIRSWRGALGQTATAS